jgi:hypothetical protein
MAMKAVTKAPVTKAPVKGGVIAYTPAPFVDDAWPKVLFVPDDPNAAALPSNWQVVTVTLATLDTVYKMTSDKAKIGGNPGTLYINKDKPDNPGDIKSGK